MNGHSQTASSGASKAGVPPRLLRAIEGVRAHLPSATDFAELYERFDDHVARSPELWTHSHPREHEILLSIALAIAKQVRPGFEPKSSRLYEVGDTGFWHGAIIGTNALACLFYDDRARVGLVAASNPFDGSHRTELVRFKLVRPGSPGEASRASGRLPC